MTGQRRTKRQAGRAVCAAVLALVLVCAVEAASAQGPPATQPADPIDIAALVALARRANVAHWSAPHVERFDRPADAAGWKASPGCTLAVAGGRMVIAPSGPFVVFRPLPGALHAAKGIRFDLWVETTLNNELAEKIGLMISQSAPAVGGNPEYRYEFAHGQTGKLQQFIVQYMDHYTKFEPLPQGRMLHVYFEVAGAGVRGRREDCPELAWTYGSGPTLNEKTFIGLTGTCKRVRVMQLSIRSIEPGPTAAERERLLRTSPFGGQEGFDRFVTERLIPSLNSERYREREEATELLRTLMPLSSPAIRAALADDRSLPPETLARLQLLREAAPVLTVAPPDLDEAPTPTTTAPDERETPAPNRAPPDGVDKG